MTSKELRRATLLWPLFFQLTFLEAAVAFLALLRIPAEGARLILGFSAARWAMLLPLMAVMAASLALARVARRRPAFVTRWLDAAARPRLFEVLAAASALLAAGAGIGSFLLRWYDPDRLLPFFERAWPLLAFVMVASLQSAFWLLALRFGVHKVDFDARKPALAAFASLLLVFGFVALTRLGVTPDKAYWGEPGVPIQGWQMGLALLGGGLFLTLGLCYPQRGVPLFERHPRLADFLLPLSIWALAAGIWSNVPDEVLKNSFYFPIDPPANAPFPYSDSGYYDYMAHSLLIGTDYTGEIPTRPLYIVFLTILHHLFGERYDLIILGQTLALAFIPVVFYALGKAIHSRAAGLVIALLAVFREWTTLLVSSETRVSNTKTLLVDLPTLLLILLACLLAFRWLERKHRLGAFIAGGVFGVLLLLRTQSMLILPVLFLVAFFALRPAKQDSSKGTPPPKGTPWLTPLLLFLLGLAASITPWLTHNYLHSGHVSFDTSFEYQLIASQYTYDGMLNYTSTDVQGKSLTGILLAFFLSDPAFVTGFILNHFLATEIGALLALPLIAPFDGLQAPVNVYWTSFDGALAWNNALLVIGYLAVIAVGLGAAWKRWRWAGLLPLAFNLGYALANGIGRFSGWRYDLPADWIAYFYFGVGAAEVLVWGSQVFGAPKREQPANPPPAVRPIQFVPYAVCFALIGAVPWIAKSLNAPRYPDLAPAAIQEQLGGLPEVQAMGVAAADIQQFAGQSEAVALLGRPLYPRAFPRGVGLSSSNPWQSYAIRDYPRLGFLLLNENVREVVLPIKHTQVENIHAIDALILGCERGAYVEARLVAFPDDSLVYLSERGMTSCSGYE
ncbi:MAG: hypothetical protein ACOYYJ_06140 [Chloroflexota bacterium]